MNVLNVSAVIFEWVRALRKTNPIKRIINGDKYYFYGVPDEMDFIWCYYDPKKNIFKINFMCFHYFFSDMDTGDVGSIKNNTAQFLGLVYGKELKNNFVKNVEVLTISGFDMNLLYGGLTYKIK